MKNNDEIIIYSDDGICNENTYERYKITTLTEEVVDLFYTDIYTEVNCTHGLKEFLKKHNLMGQRLETIKRIKIRREYFTDYTPELYHFFDLIQSLKTTPTIFKMITPKQTIVYKTHDVLYIKNHLLVQRESSTFSNVIKKTFSYNADKLCSIITEFKIGNMNWIELSRKYYSYNVLDNRSGIVYDKMCTVIKVITNEENTATYYYTNNVLRQIREFSSLQMIDEFGNKDIDCTYGWNSAQQCSTSAYVYKIHNTYNDRNELVCKSFNDFASKKLKETHFTYDQNRNLETVKHFWDGIPMIDCRYVFHYTDENVLESIIVHDYMNQGTTNAWFTMLIME